MIKFTIPEVIKMNKRQREALCNMMQEEANEKIYNLRKPERPTLNNYLTNKIMNGEIEIQPSEVILDLLRKKIKKYSRYDSLIENDYNGKGTIKFEAESFFIIPEDFANEVNNYEIEVERIENEIQKIRDTVRALKMHIMVGSNEALTPIMQQIDAIGYGGSTNINLLGNG